MKSIRNNYFVLLALVILFALPGVSAYVFYQHPQWLGSTRTNRGELLTPPVLLTELSSNQTKWRFVLWNPTVCDKQCKLDLEQLARVRLALGRRLYDVELHLLLNDAFASLPISFQHQLHEEDIHVVNLSSKTLHALPILTQHPKIFIANPDNYLILSYDMPVNSADIFHDIKQLLKKE